MRRCKVAQSMRLRRCLGADGAGVVDGVGAVGGVGRVITMGRRRELGP
ncbi:MAG: hypothetical protein Q8K32_27260 [Archangium sp.]|nr:hypothetical protein [Archangium sp.]